MCRHGVSIVFSVKVQKYKTMLILFETAAGFAVFKALDEAKLQNVDNLGEYFASPEAASQIVQLEEFHKFKDSAEALAAAVALNEGTISKSLKSVIKKALKKELSNKMIVSDAKLGASIKEKIPNLKIVCDNKVSELIRCIRGQMDSLIPGISEKESSAMMLGLGHNLARYKLKFSPDKVDTMVVQAVKLLDDLDKELNNYVMRAKEWYGWHFPELAKILTDNTSYIHTIKKMGFREHARTTDFSDVLSEELAERVKEAAEVSMGCEISDHDIDFMQQLCDQILDLTSYRTHLFEYLGNRMRNLSPNLTTLVGELIGARLLAHAGTLINLAKNPASTIQLIGAEKALFRALKTRKSTPKYGLIYHAELVSSAPANCKGKMSRVLAAKAALAARVDALAEETDLNLGINWVVALRKKGAFWSSGRVKGISGQSKHVPARPHFSENREGHYNVGQDSAMGGKRPLVVEEDDQDSQPRCKKVKKEEVKPEPIESAALDEVSGEKKKKKKKKDHDKSTKSEPDADDTQEVVEPVEGEKKKKKKKKDKDASQGEMDVSQEEIAEPAEGEKKKKKKKDKSFANTEEDMDVSQDTPAAESGEKKKKKKKKDLN